MPRRSKSRVNSTNIYIHIYIRIFEEKDRVPYRTRSINGIKGSKERGKKRKEKAKTKEGKVYKDVGPGPLDFRQRGTPELRFSIVKAGRMRELTRSKGNLFRA